MNKGLIENGTSGDNHLFVADFEAFCRGYPRCFSELKSICADGQSGVTIVCWRGMSEAVGFAAGHDNVTIVALCKRGFALPPPILLRGKPLSEAAAAFLATEDGFAPLNSVARTTVAGWCLGLQALQSSDMHPVAQ